MQFTTNKKALRDAVARVNAIVPSESRLSGILIEAVNTAGVGYVNVWADDLDISYTVRVAAEVAGAGSFMVDAAKFKKTVADGNDRP